MASPIRILVIEDNRLVREGLGALLAAVAGLKVVSLVESTAAGLQQVEALRPEVALVDAVLGNRSSHRMVQTCHESFPETRVIVMDLLPLQQDVIEFIRAGASGFVVKDANIEDLIRTIRAVAAGEKVVPQSFTSTLLSHIAGQAVAGQLTGATDAVRMTKREREVIALISEGMSNKEIAQRLHLATYTVKSHVHNILEKLALHSRLQIAAHSHRTGASERRRSAH